MKNSPDLDKKLSKNRDDLKDKIALSFVDIDGYLKDLEQQIPPEKEKGRTILNKVRELFNKQQHWWLYGCDIEYFASHLQCEQTPLNSECC